jgi:hypothetical protein
MTEERRVLAPRVAGEPRGARSSRRSGRMNERNNRTQHTPTTPTPLLSLLRIDGTHTLLGQALLERLGSVRS